MNNAEAPLTIKKEHKRYLTAAALLCLLALYLFIGAITTLWKAEAGIQYVNILFILINLAILGLAIYELILVSQEESWPFVIKVFIMLGIGVLYLWPWSGSQYAFWFYNQINLKWITWWVNLLFLAAVLSYFLLLSLFSKKVNSISILWLFAFGLYLTIAFKAITIYMLNSNFGFTLVIWLLLMTICTDSFAFFGGKIFGKNKLAPKISPNKTVEGALCGVGVGFLVGVLYALLFYFLSKNHQLNDHWVVLSGKFSAEEWAQILVYVLLAFLLCICAVVGDLLFSFIKRKKNIKDFGIIIPGHGGLLDRLDSLSLVVVVMYIMTSFFVVVQ